MEYKAGGSHSCWKAQQVEKGGKGFQVEVVPVQMLRGEKVLIVSVPTRHQTLL